MAPPDHLPYVRAHNLSTENPYEPGDLPIPAMEFTIVNGKRKWRFTDLHLEQAPLLPRIERNMIYLQLTLPTWSIEHGFDPSLTKVSDPTLITEMTEVFLHVQALFPYAERPEWETVKAKLDTFPVENPRACIHAVRLDLRYGTIDYDFLLGLPNLWKVMIAVDYSKVVEPAEGENKGLVGYRALDSKELIEKDGLQKILQMKSLDEIEIYAYKDKPFPLASPDMSYQDEFWAIKDLGNWFNAEFTKRDQEVTVTVKVCTQAFNANDIGPDRWEVLPTGEPDPVWTRNMDGDSRR